MSTTTNFAEFGRREIVMTRDLLDAMIEQGFPSDFYDGSVTVMFNKYSGNVFLTNDEYQVVMLNGDKLESFYNSPYEGKEGFFDDLLAEYDDMPQEDKDWFRDLAEQLGRSDEIPSEGDEENNEE